MANIFNSKIKLLLLFGLLAWFSHSNAQNKKVLLVVADYPVHYNDVKSKLVNTGMFSTVDIFDAIVGTPTLSLLQGYDAVLTWTNFTYQNSGLLGDNLAAYVEAGGGVVTSVFGNTTWNFPSGNFATRYQVIVPHSFTSSPQLTIGTRHVPDHPILQGVISFDGGAYSWRGTSQTLTSGSYRIADWSDGQLLIAAKDNVGPASVRRVDLNFWPTSGDVYSGAWLTYTNGAQIIANALLYVASSASNQITTSSLSSATYCQGSTIPITYTVNGIYNAGNIFTTQLSDASGSFSSPTIIGSNNSTSSGIINTTIPPNTPAGAHYRVRVVSSNPVVTGTDNGSDLIIGDNLKPTFTCPANQDVDLNGSCKLIVPDLITGLTGSDNCGTVTFTQNPVAATALTSSHNQLHNVVVTADDGNGNTEECTVVLTGKDVTPPTFTCPSDRNVNLNTSCQLIVPDIITELTGNDNCGTVTFTQSPVAGTVLSFSHNQTYGVIITASDGNGNSSPCTVVLTAKDITPPTFSCPSDRNVNLNSGCQLIVPDLITGLTGNDNCGTVTFTQNPVAGTALQSSNNQTHNVVITAGDGNGNTQTCTVVLTAKDATNPTAVCKSIEVYLGLSGTVSITGADVDNGSTDNCGPVSLSVSPNSFNTTNVGSNTVALTVNDASGNSSTCQTTVTVKKRPTTLLYTGDGSEQYSDQQLLTAELRDQLTNAVLNRKLISFALGSQSSSGTTNGSGIASANLILIQDPAPVYAVKSTFAGDAIFVASNDEDLFDISQEDARAYYTGTLFASTGTGATTTITLSATVRDITAESGDPAYDNLAGDIRNAKVSFIDRTTNAIIATVPVGLASLADPKTGTATYNWNVNIGTSNSRDYTIGVVVNNYYSRNVSGENTIVTVSKSMDDFITGGGYLKSTSSSGQKAGDQGANNNFGFNVKFNKSKTNLQGNINTIIRRTEADGLHVYQVKGNSMTSLSATTGTSTAPGKATFNSKASIQDITNPLLPPISVDGGASLQVTMTDAGEPGTYDAIAITVWNKQGGLWFASNWDGVKTQEQLLAGGNLRVNTGSPNPGTISNTLTLTSSANPSLSSQAVTFKATVIENNAATPTGYIMFIDGTTVLATVPVTTAGNGTSASFATSGLAVGSHQVKAYYSGDSKFGSSITGISQTVNASLTSTRPASALIKEEKKYSANFEVIVSPNPASHSFSITVRGNYGVEKTIIKVFNVLGGLVETRNSLTEGQTFKLGENYRPGIYLIEVAQGKQRKTLKLMKQSD